MWDVIVKAFQDFVVAYGGVVGLAIISFALRWVAAHAKNARLKNIAILAHDVVASVDSKDLTNEEKKKQAVSDLISVYNENTIFGNMTPEQADMRVEGALKKIRIAESQIK